MKNINFISLKIVSLLSIGYGMFVFAKNFKFSLFMLNNFQNVVHETSTMLIIGNIFFALILPLLYIGGGIGIFYLRNWGRRIVLLCFVATIILDLYGLINTVLNSAKIKSQEIDASVVAITKSLMPDYTISILAIICFVFLLRQKM